MMWTGQRNYRSKKGRLLLKSQRTYSDVRSLLYACRQLNYEVSLSTDRPTDRRKDGRTD
jgi:hypothetical protein